MSVEGLLSVSRIRGRFPSMWLFDTTLTLRSHPLRATSQRRLERRRALRPPDGRPCRPQVDQQPVPDLSLGRLRRLVR